MTTVGELIEQNVNVTRYCQWCKDWGEVDLKRIAREKGWEFSMLDRLPLCTNGDCQGMLRFNSHRGMRSQMLMTKVGDQRFQEHSAWIFRTRMIEARRRTQKSKRPPAG